ncbi:MAG: hypothetical protein AAGJ83_02975 [Planctomycetota bacterium]
MMQTEKTMTSESSHSNSELAELQRLDSELSDSGPEGFDVLADYLRNAASISSALDFCAADLEWKFRNHQVQSRRSEQNRLSASYVNALRDAGFEVNQEERLSLLRTQWFCESAWGAAPTITEFAHRFQIPHHDQDHFLSDLVEIAPWSLSASGPDSMIPSTRLESNWIEIGRQAVNEPKPIHFLPSSRKLVLFESSFHRVSRRQLRIRRLGTWSIGLSNIGKAACKLDADLRLEPGDEVEQRLPFHLSIASVHVAVEASLD